MKLGSAFGFGASRVLASMSQALSLIILARGMQPDRYGMVSAYIASAMFIAVALDLGTSSVVLRYGNSQTSEGDSDFLHRQWSASALTTGLGLSGVSIATAFTLGALFVGGVEPWWSIATIAIWVGFERVSDLMNAYHLGALNEMAVSRNLVSRRISALFLQTLLLFLVEDSLIAFCGGLAFSIVVNLPPLLVFMRNSTRSRRSAFAYPFKESMHFWIAATSSQSRELEVPAVSHFSGATSAGVYSVAVRLQRPLLVVGVALAQLLLPRIAGHHTHPIRGLRAILIATFISLLASTVAIPWIGDILVFVLGSQYLPATDTARIALLFSAPIAFSPSIGGLLQGLGRANVVARVGMSYAVISIVCTCLASIAGGAALAAAAVGLVFTIKYVHLLVLALASSHD